jgi:hypothetical protein
VVMFSPKYEPLRCSATSKSVQNSRTRLLRTILITKWQLILGFPGPPTNGQITKSAHLCESITINLPTFVTQKRTRAWF